MKKISLIIIAVGILIIAIALYSGRSSFLNSVSGTTSPSPSASVDLVKVTEKIDFGGLKTPEIATAEATPSATVLDLLHQTKSITTTKYSFGTSVDSIEGVTGGTNGSYWIFYVNGKESQVGADQVKVKPNDIVEWKFEKSQ